jgi:hypothetical protein
MNDQYTPTSSAKGAFFHYDPNGLILVGSEEYESYSTKIRAVLTESFL